MTTSPTGPSRLHAAANVVLILDVVIAIGACGCGIYLLATGQGLALGLGFVGGGLAALLFGILAYCQVLLLEKFTRYAYRGYEAQLASAELQRRQEEHVRAIAENSSLSEWAKRMVYREKDYEFLRDTIHGAIVRQDWETAEHLIQDMETEFGYRDEAAHVRGQLEQARKATVDERLAAAVARFDGLCNEHKWAQAHKECERLQTLYPKESRMVDLSHEIDRRREVVKAQLLKEYEEAVRSEDIDRAHRLLFALDQYLVPEEAAVIKKSARGVFRARLEQIKTRFSIAVSYKQFHNAIAAGEQLLREFPNSGYAQEISKLLPMLRERAGKQRTPPHVNPAAR